MTTPKRRDIKSRRQRQRQIKRRNTFVVIIIGILLVIAVIVIPPIAKSQQPPVDITPITPHELPMQDGRALGDPNAPVRIDIFEDFQCSACVAYTFYAESLVIDDLVANGQVYYVFRHFPFMDDYSISKESDQAANASMCAAEQNRFWEYHDMAYLNWHGVNEGTLSDDRLVAYAEALELDMNAFNACFKANKYEEIILQDYRDGIELGVQGTPSVFVNQQMVKPGYVPSYEEIKQAVDAVLEAGQ